MQLPEEIEAAVRKEEAEAKAAVTTEVQHVETGAAAELAEVKSWWRENKEPVIVVILACISIGFLAGYYFCKFIEHR
jgi:hypothetical protein